MEVSCIKKNVVNHTTNRSFIKAQQMCFSSAVESPFSHTPTLYQHVTNLQGDIRDVLAKSHHLPDKYSIGHNRFEPNSHNLGPLLVKTTAWIKLSTDAEKEQSKPEEGCYQLLCLGSFLEPRLAKHVCSREEHTDTCTAQSDVQTDVWSGTFYASAIH